MYCIKKQLNFHCLFSYGSLLFVKFLFDDSYLEVLLQFGARLTGAMKLQITFFLQKNCNKTNGFQHENLILSFKYTLKTIMIWFACAKKYN